MKKIRYIKVRVSEEEHAKFLQIASNKGTGISSVVREAAVRELHPSKPGDDPVIKQIGMDVEDLWKTITRSSEMLEQVLRIVQELLALRDPQAAARLAAANNHSTRS